MDVWAQAIASAGVVLAAVLPVWIPLAVSTRRRAAAAERSAISAASKATEAREAITNGHQEHIRNQLDRQHREAMDAIDGVRTELAKDIGGLRSEMRQERQERAALGERVHELEKVRARKR